MNIKYKTKLQYFNQLNASLLNKRKKKNLTDSKHMKSNLCLLQLYTYIYIHIVNIQIHK